MMQKRHMHHSLMNVHTDIWTVWTLMNLWVTLSPQLLAAKATFGVIGSLIWFWTPIEQLDRTDHTVNSVDIQKTVTRAPSIPCIFCILSKWSVSAPPPPFPHAHLCTPLYSQPLYWHKKSTARTLIKCYLQLELLTLPTWHSNWEQPRPSAVV